MESLISVIVPIYNVAQFLPRCLESIVNQTYRNLQVLLVDDGSTDDCGEICDQYASRDERITVIHKQNAGVAAARNTGLSLAAGECILFVDSDDWLALDAVQALYDRMQQDNSDMAAGRHLNVYEDGTEKGDARNLIKDAVYAGPEILKRIGSGEILPVCPWGKLYRKDIFTGLSYPDLICGEDLWIFPAIIDRCRKISVTDDLVYYYYQRRSSIMHVASERSRRDCLEANLHMVQVLWEKGMLNSAVKWYERCIVFAYQVEKAKEARCLLRTYFDRKETIKLLLPQKTKNKVIWLAVYLPFIKRIALWLKKMGLKK